MTNTADAIFSSPEFADFLFNNISVAIFLVDKNRRVRRINAPFKTLFLATDEATLDQLCGNALGCEYAIAQNKPCGETTECGNCNIHNSLQRDESDADSIKTSYVTRQFFINGQATPKHFQLTTRQAKFEGESMTIVALHDVTELEDQRAKIEEMANRDFLTGLANRRYFFEVGESLFQNAKRGNISISVAMFDIDHFKRVNETWGHAAGDFVIKEIAEILIANLRKADVISRFGGEEFCIILHCKDRDDSYTVVDKLRLLVEQHSFMFEGKKINVTISAGLTSVVADSLDAMVDKADEMLYKAKNGGRNRTEEYTGEPK
jgi:diguanylate cyclase (GGDEF) domain